MGAYIINIPDTVDRIIYVNVGPDSGRTYISSHRVEDLTPYTEPDIEQVRKEAYEEGYKKCLSLNNFGHLCVSCDKYEQGLADAWEAARKIAYMYSEKRKKIFGENLIRKIQDIYSASECIEKIRQYEQEKEEIKVGDEVKNTQTDARFIVTHMWVNNHGEKGVSGFNYECSAFSTALDLVRKTGRHFPEIAEVLQKMKEADNG